MKTRSAIPLVATLTWCLSVATAEADSSNKLRGVAPSDLQRYIPNEKGHWTCLDSSKTISFSAVNDDYCDCLDGSDEPGTSACGNGLFYCANEGHIPTRIKTSRVNDGVCDPDCCDGSDEYSGLVECPNVCEEVGAVAKQERARLQLIQQEGSKLRKDYIDFGKAAKAKMVLDLAQFHAQTEDLERAVEEAKKILDAATLAQEKYHEGSKGDREASRREQLAPLIQEQASRLARAKNVRNKLRATLQNLKENYNKNYHDTAVKNTITGFDDYITGLGEDHESEASTDEEQVDPTEYSITPDERINNLMDQTYVIQREIGTLYDLLDNMSREYNTENNDEAVQVSVKVVEEFSTTWVTDRQEFGDEAALEVPAELTDESPEAEKLKDDADVAQSAFDEASDRRTQVQDGIRDIENKMKADLGKDEAFAKLFDECFDFKDIEYTYSVCLFGDANQRSHSTTFLGKFSHWEGANYDVQVYSGGTKCWNGPDRSVKLVMTCGTQNEIISVAEPAKCEYVFRFQTPAVCPVLPEHENEASTPVDTEEEAPPKHTRHDEL
ncbi:hypothetical protein BG006_011144 [Podila minutissima]|uniref:Glucosidase 2 subunit beta n=1 Tax=Podila minutissima TaxID=64525 RepID=A0A9P5SCU0_9FUNG|nr:hypothetical protein BG006_011144 [Podila minutissima]